MSLTVVGLALIYKSNKFVEVLNWLKKGGLPGCAKKNKHGLVN